MAGAVCTSSFGQRAVKYKDIYSKIGQEPAEHSFLKLSEFQKLQPEYPNTYVQSALIQWAWLQNEDPFLNYPYVQTLIYNTKLYLGLAINKIQKDEKEVKKNKAFYTNLGLGTNADEIKQEDVIAELERLLGIVKEYEDNVTKIITNFNKTIEKYNECTSIYNGIVARQSNYKHLLLTNSADLRQEMTDLAEKYDSVNTYFKNFKTAHNAYKQYRLKEYNQQMKTIPIVTYRLEGLTSSNFINPEIPVWDYKSWVSEAFKEMDGNIAKLKTNTEKEILNLRSRIEKLEKANAETDSIQVIVAPNALVNLVEKYDYESLLSSSLKYEAALGNLKISSMRSANNTSNMESFNEDYSQKGLYYYDLYMLSQEAKNMLDIQASRITDNNCNMHEPIINKLYGNKSQFMNGYKDRQTAEIDKVMANNYENLKLYTLHNLSPEGVEAAYAGSVINAKPFEGTFATAGTGSYSTISTCKDNSGNRYVCGYKKTGESASNGFVAKFDSDENLLWVKDLNVAAGGVNKVVQILPSKFAGFVAVATNSNLGACKTSVFKMDNSGKQLAKADMQSSLHPTVSYYDEISDKVTTAFKGNNGNESTAMLDEACIESAIFGMPGNVTSPSFKIKGQIADIVPNEPGYMVICNYTELNGGNQNLKAESDIAAVNISGSKLKAEALNAGKNAVAFKAFQVNAETISITGAYDKMGTGITANQKPAYIIVGSNGNFKFHN